LGNIRKFPRWFSWEGGFTYQTKPNGEILEEVFRFLDGTWSAGKESRGTFRKFGSLPEALEYGERQAEVRVHCYALNRARYARYARRLRMKRLTGVNMKFSQWPAGVTATTLQLSPGTGDIKVQRI